MGNILWFLVIMATGFGCVGEEPTGVSALEFRLVAVDGTGREKSVFMEGDRIGLRPKVINHSRNDLEYFTQLECWVYQLDQFMVIYNCSDLNSSQLSPLGRMYLHPGICTHIGLIRRIDARTEITLTTHYWDENPENEPLPVGKYCSFVKGEGILDRTSVPIDIEVSFEVK